MDCQSYSLSLAQGLEWEFVPTDKTAPWLNEFARILELEPKEDTPLPKVLLSKIEQAFDPEGPRICEINERFSRSFPSEGWSAENYGCVRVYRHEGERDVLCEFSRDDHYEIEVLRGWLVLGIVHREALRSGGIAFHSGFAQRDGVGVLFSAPGDGGKSTTCARIPPPWKALCDDEVLLRPNEGGGYIAHPFPTWSDYLFERETRGTWNVQESAPVSAIFFLKQSDTESVTRLGAAEALGLMMGASRDMWNRYWRRMKDEQKFPLREMLFENVCEAAKSLPAYVLELSLTGAFWEKVEEVVFDAR